MTAEFNFRRITTYDELVSIESEWRALYELAGQPSPFLDFDWVRMCWQQVVRRGGTPLAALVQYDRRLVMAAALERRRFRVLFCRYYGLADLLPQHDDILLHPEGDASGWLRVLQRGLRSTLRDSAMLLPRLADHSSFAQRLLGSGRARARQQIAKVDLEHGYAAYLSHFSRPTRNQMRRMWRQLGEGARVRHSDPDSFDSDFDWLLAQKRAWTPPGNAKLRAWLTDKATEDDFRLLARHWIASGKMRLGVLEGRGARVAAVLMLMAGEIAILYTTTYDPAMGGTSPGRTVALSMIEWSANNGHLTVDFMGGRSSWKDRLKTGDYTRYRYKLPL